jgi:hypothetical protein
MNKNINNETVDNEFVEDTEPDNWLEKISIKPELALSPREYKRKYNPLALEEECYNKIFDFIIKMQDDYRDVISKHDIQNMLEEIIEQMAKKTHKTRREGNDER